MRRRTKIWLIGTSQAFEARFTLIPPCAYRTFCASRFRVSSNSILTSRHVPWFAHIAIRSTDGTKDIRGVASSTCCLHPVSSSVVAWSGKLALSSTFTHYVVNIAKLPCVKANIDVRTAVIANLARQQRAPITTTSNICIATVAISTNARRVATTVF